MSKHLCIWLSVVLVIAASRAGAEPAPSAADTPRTGAIRGRVTNSRGVAQAAVSVTVTRPDGAFVKKALTQDNGRFDLSGLLPGLYALQVIQPHSLPFWKGPISVEPGSQISLDINLLALADSAELGAPDKPSEAREQWKWVLRSSYPPRPVLRFWEETDASRPATIQDARERALRGTVEFLAGNASRGFGADPGLRTAFDMEYDMRGGDALDLAGSAGWEQGTPAASFRAAWNRQSADTASSLSTTVRQLFLAPEFSRGVSTEDVPSAERIQSVTVGYEQQKWLTPRLHLQYGSLVDAVSLARRMHQWSPYGRITYSPHQDAQLIVLYTGASPRVLPSESGPHGQLVEQWLAIPQLSSRDPLHPVLERGKHLEAAWEQKLGHHLQLHAAAFYDSMSDLALSLAVQDSAGIAAGLLRDPFSNRHFLSGGDYASPGARAALGTKLPGNSEVVFGYIYGGGLQAISNHLVAESAQSTQELRDQLRSKRSHSFTLKVISEVPLTHTRLTTSYRWMPHNAVAPSDPYNFGLSQAEPYLKVVLLQPIPSPDILPGQLQAMADFSNLLAQGYLYVHTPNGGSGQIFPAARSFRGGVSLIF